MRQNAYSSHDKGVFEQVTDAGLNQDIAPRFLHQQARQPRSMRLFVPGCTQISIDILMNPTSYMVLERLANSGLIRKNNTLIDYGTEKGRVCFYLSYHLKI